MSMEFIQVLRMCHIKYFHFCQGNCSKHVLFSPGKCYKKAARRAVRKNKSAKRRSLQRCMIKVHLFQVLVTFTEKIWPYSPPYKQVSLLITNLGGLRGGHFNGPYNQAVDLWTISKVLKKKINCTDRQTDTST